MIYLKIKVFEIIDVVFVIYIVISGEKCLIILLGFFFRCIRDWILRGIGVEKNMLFKG